MHRDECAAPVPRTGTTFAAPAQGAVKTGGTHGSNPARDLQGRRATKCSERNIACSAPAELVKLYLAVTIPVVLRQQVLHKPRACRQAQLPQRNLQARGKRRRPAAAGGGGSDTVAARPAGWREVSTSRGSPPSGPPGSISAVGSPSLPELPRPTAVRHHRHPELQTATAAAHPWRLACRRQGRQPPLPAYRCAAALNRYNRVTAVSIKEHLLDRSTTK